LGFGVAIFEILEVGAIRCRLMLGWYMASLVGSRAFWNELEKDKKSVVDSAKMVVWRKVE